MQIQLPKLLDIPDKLLPIITDFNRYPYFMIDGGRSSGKSHSVVRLMLYLAETIPGLRVFFGREVQNSIEESIYQLVKEVIVEYGLNFDVAATKIDHRTNGSQLRFRGFREHGAVNIKGLQGVDILVIDEAQQLKKPTLDIILPTIRENNSRIFFMLNRTLKDDPVFVAFKDRQDCLKIHIDYFENKHCPQKSIHEAEECRKRNMDDYKHIWLGEPMEQANNAAFRNVREIVGDWSHNIEPQPGFDYVMGADLARSVDYTVFIVLCVQTKKVVYFERMENENRTSWNYQEEKGCEIAKKYNNAVLVPDSTGVGDPIVERWYRRGLNVFCNDDKPGVRFTAGMKENLIEKLKVAIELKLIQIPNVSTLVSELIDFESILMPSGNRRYSAPEGKHDDCVIALALALWGIRHDVYESWKPREQKTVKQLITDDFWGRVRKDIARDSENSERFITE